MKKYGKIKKMKEFINYARKTPSFNYGDTRAFHSLTADQEVY
ncbi:hypothetical protein [Anaerotignum lactatifermentans]|nr:hypothetical protein [Anaerotignum lactatifermentans]